jgi:DNA polymerase-3 subunit beta
MSGLQFTITREEFADAINWVARALPGKPLNPLLGAIRLTNDTVGGGIALQAFDYEVAAETTAAADVAAPGAALVSGRLLQAISKALARKPVEFKTEGAVARIVCGAAEFTLPTMAVDQYPALPVAPPEAGSVDAGQFAEAIAQTVFAVHRGEGYASIKAICCDADPLGGVTLTATDRYRVATRTIPWQSALDKSGGVSRLLVPTRALGDTARLGGDTVTLGFEREPRMLSFGGDQRRAMTQLLGEDFPNTEPLFPNEYSAVATVATADLAEPLARALALDGRDYPRVKLSFAPGVLHMVGGEDGVGGMSEGLEIDFAGDPLDMWLNPKYLLEGLQATRADKVAIGLTAPKRPLTLAAYDGEPPVGPPFPALHSDFRYLLMPAQPPVAGA